MNIRRLIGIGVTSALLVVSCGQAASPSPAAPTSPGQSTPPSTSAPTEAPPQPVDGGTLTIAVPSDIISLDVDQPGGTTSTSVKAMLYEGLVQYRPNASSIEIEPALATDWTADGTTWTFNLRSGVMFHDGTAFDAAAVKAHFDRMLGPEEPLNARDWTPFLDSVDVVDPDTVRFTTKFEDPDFLVRLAGQSGLIESPTAYAQFGADFGRNPVGTGPFQFVEWIADVQVTIERNTAYWDGPAHLDRVVIRPIPETGARLVAVQSGDVHLATNIAPEQIPQVQGDSNLQLDLWPSTRQIFVGMHNYKPPFRNEMVRQALNHAIDWTTISSTIYQGMVEPLGGPIAATAVGFSPVTPFSYDPALARSMLAEAGFPAGFDVTFTATNGAYLKDFELEQVLQQQLGEVGVRLDLQVVEFARYIELVRQPTAESELVMWIDSWARDTAVQTLRDRYHCDSLRPAGVNITGYCNPEVDALIEQAERSLDDSARQAALAQAQQLVADEAPAIWGVVQQSAWAARSNVMGALRTQGEGVWVDEDSWLAAN